MKKLYAISILALLLLSTVATLVVATEKRTEDGIRQEILKRIDDRSITNMSNRIQVQTELIQRLQTDSNVNAAAIESISRSLDSFIVRLQERNLTKDKSYHSFVVKDASFGATTVTKIEAKEKGKILFFIPVTVTDVFEVNENGEIVNSKVSTGRILFFRRG